MKMQRNSRGFSVIETLLVLVAVGLIGFTGWYVWNANHDANEALKTNQSTTGKAIKQSQQKKYQDKLLGYSVQYPSTWKVTTTSDNQGGAGFPISLTKIKSPSGTELTLREDYGGKGGGPCENIDTEKPFEANNICRSSEFVKLYPLSTLTYDEDGDKIPIQVAHFNYSPGRVTTAGPTLYSTCLVASTNKNFPIKLNTPQLDGFMYPPFVTFYDANGNLDQSKPLYLYACASGSSDKFYESSDGKTAETILSSFKFE